MYKHLISLGMDESSTAGGLTVVKDRLWLGDTGLAMEKGQFLIVTASVLLVALVAIKSRPWLNWCCFLSKSFLPVFRPCYSLSFYLPARSWSAV